MSVTAAKLRKLCPSARQDIIDAIVSNWDVAVAAGINTPLRISHFLAQIATETGGLRRLEEDLNYSAARLRVVWPSRFKTTPIAKKYEHNPRALAMYVYGGRLGNAHPEDGWVYRGSGMIQTTGRANFAAIGYDDNPEALRQPKTGFTAAVEFWTDNGINRMADADNITAVRRKVNGGTNGLAEARAYLSTAKSIFMPAMMPLLAEPEPEPETPPEIEPDIIPPPETSPDIIGHDPVATSDTTSALQGKLAVINSTVDKIDMAKDSAIVRVGMNLVKGNAGAVATVVGAPIAAAAVSDQHQGFWDTFLGWLAAVPPLAWFGITVALLLLHIISSNFFVRKRIELQKSGLVLPKPPGAG